ncbi:MAG: glycerate kinase [Cytophagaceae bacterium]|nr:glycerate kinase [Cytophagaceae bacterium]
MKILLTSDKFRSSMTAAEACRAMAEGARMVDASIELFELPLADGGEGTLDVLIETSQGRRVTTPTQDPLGRPIRAEYGVSADGNTAFVELASASGLHHLAPNERDALRANTFGTGTLIRAALQAGATRIILGVGGSASTDAGTGLAAALGYRFLDASGQALYPCGGNLSRIAQIDASDVAFDFSKVTIDVACDVTAPLFGPEGAAHVYAPQKGATPEQVELLDAGLRNLAEKAEAPPGITPNPLKGAFLPGFFINEKAPFRGLGVIPGVNSAIPGAGAAGGAAFGAMVFLGATLRSGVDLLLELTRFDEKLNGVDLIITGEGKLDAQTLQGKLIGGICQRAAAYQIPVIALCGTLEADPLALRTMGLTYAASILPRPMTLAEALAEGPELLKNAAFFVVNLFSATRFVTR